MRLVGCLVTVESLTLAERAQMFALMDAHYENVALPAFEADLAEKQWVILVRDPRDGGVCGFSTQMLLDVEVEGRPMQVLFSGDTIIARDRWGDSALAQVWGRLALSLIDAHPGIERYWFLISKGYKTYRFLPVFFREYYPRPGTVTPPWAKAVIDALGRHKYRTAYDPHAGVVRAEGYKDRLRPGVADLTPERLKDPHVRFFSERNSGHARGDELCCIAPLTRENFTPAAYRVIGREPVALGASS
ncbi:MAG TPA: hypothetical protein VKI65_13635 [Gemmataceae bacterium]|nr:hypothetical protein [Gemmataceae bacterium]